MALTLVGGLLAAACGGSDEPVERGQSVAVNRDTAPSGETTTPDPTDETATPDTSTPDPSTPDTDATTPESGSSERAEIRGELAIPISEVDEMVAYVESATGETFVRPPVIVSQDGATFDEGLLPDEDDEEELAEETELLARLYQSIGLSNLSGPELEGRILDFLTSPAGVAGYYDPEIDELYIPDDYPDLDSLRSTLVHELTHALDGQRHDLFGLLEAAGEPEADDEGFDSALGLRAIVEGRASAVEESYVRDMDLDPQLGVDAELPDIPAAYLFATVLPYQLGPLLIGAAGGSDDTADLIEDHPETSEQVLFLDRFLADEQPLEVAAPDAEGPVLDQGTLGAIGVLIWLGDDGLLTGVNLQGAFEAAEGWGGDRYVMWGDDRETCLRMRVSGDDSQDHDELVEAFESWASDLTGREVVDEDDSVLVTGCAPLVS